MDMQEALKIVREFKDKNSEDCSRAAIALADAAEGLIGGIFDPSAVIAKYESWAQLEWAGRKFRSTAEQIERQERFWEAVGTILVKLAAMALAKASEK